MQTRNGLEKLAETVADAVENADRRSGEVDADATALNLRN